MVVEYTDFYREDGHTEREEKPTCFFSILIAIEKKNPMYLCETRFRKFQQSEMKDAFEKYTAAYLPS